MCVALRLAIELSFSSSVVSLLTLWATLMDLSWPPKRPQDILDYAVEWSGRLRGEAIVQSRFTVPRGVVKLSESVEKTTTRVWLTGGQAGAHYPLDNQITTSTRRKITQRIYLPVTD